MALTKYQNYFAFHVCFGPKKRTTALDSVGRPTGAPLRTMARAWAFWTPMLCAALDGLGAPPYTVVPKQWFWPLDARFRWTRQIHPPTHTVFSSLALVEALDEQCPPPYAKPIDNNSERSETTSCVGRTHPTPLRKSAQVPFPRWTLFSVGRLPPAPLRQVADLPSVQPIPARVRWTASVHPPTQSTPYAYYVQRRS